MTWAGLHGRAGNWVAVGILVCLLALVAPRKGYGQMWGGHMGFGCAGSAEACERIGGAGVILDYRFDDALILPVGTAQAAGMGLGAQRYITDYFRAGLQGVLLDVNGPAHSGVVTLLGVTLDVAYRIANLEVSAGGLFGRGSYRLDEDATGTRVSNESFSARGARASIGWVFGPAVLFVGAHDLPANAAEFQGGRGTSLGIYFGRF